nr:magnesium-translocating P-type ATPase [Singulisphaera sp. GP187]
MTHGLNTHATRPEGKLFSQPMSGLEATGSCSPPLRVVEEASRDIQDVLLSLTSSSDGLQKLEAAVRRGKFGLNEVAHERVPRWYIQLIHSFHNPFIYLLIALAIVSFLTEDAKATVIIAIMVSISVGIRFVQEFRSSLAAERLQAMVGTTATVSRPGPRITATLPLGEEPYVRNAPRHPATREEVPIKLLVPGDVVSLSAGDMVPADLVLLSSKDLFISQSILTGESLPVEKFADPGRGVGVLDPLELANACFMGTNVVSGTAKAVVVATGPRTYLGSLAGHLVGKRVPTSFDRGVNGVSWLLLRFMLVMVPLVFVINGLTKGNWGEAFFFAVSVAVGLTPEMLPMIVTANLARGAVAMSRRKVIVKRLNAIQNFGAMDVLCTDKTGTLTQDKVVLLMHLDVNGEEDEGVFEYAFLNSHFQTGLKNLLDKAILGHEDLIESKQLTDRYLKYDEIPFDFVRRRMSVIVHEVLRGRDLLICKGAVEEVLSACRSARIGDRVVALTEEIRARVIGLSTRMNQDGLRVIAVACKEVDSLAGRQYGVADEEDMILCGFIAFLDPPKESAAPAIAALRGHGVAIKILTGDNELVARKVCRDVGLNDAGLLLGGAIEAMSDSELEEAVERVVLFAKLTPAQKARIIAALQRRGHTVGFLGDGINYAPALRDADVGISVDTGADIARESADIILLEKSLMVLEEGVIAGRATFGNILKYIKMAASSNFGNMVSVLIASVWLPFLPMLPLQILIQNLLYDLSQTAIPFDRVDEEYLERPRRWQVGSISRFMLFIGPISSVFDVTTFALMWFAFRANMADRQSLFQTGWFVEGLLSQTLIIHMIRTAKVPFLQSRATAPLMLLTLIVMATGIAIPYTRLGTAVGMVPLPAAYFPWLAATLVGYCMLTQIIKNLLSRRCGTWL